MVLPSTARAFKFVERQGDGRKPKKLFDVLFNGGSYLFERCFELFVFFFCEPEDFFCFFCFLSFCKSLFAPAVPFEVFWFFLEVLGRGELEEFLAVPRPFDEVLPLTFLKEVLWCLLALLSLIVFHVPTF